MFKVKQFIRAYAVCALWSSTGPDEAPYKCDNLDSLFDVDDISPECRASMRVDCLDFIRANFNDLQEYCRLMGNAEWSGEARAGHDFWLTRNGHGVGFWDRGLEALGDKLSAAAEIYRGVDLYPGDDGLIYGM